MKYVAFLFCIVSFISCEEKKEYRKLSDTASFLIKVQLAQLDSTINQLKNESEAGEYFFGEVTQFNRKLDSLKLELEQTGKVNKKIKKDLVKNYLGTLQFLAHLDSQQLKELYDIELTSRQDVDLLEIYIKSLYVTIIQSEPYNQFSTLASINTPKIKVGEEFSMELGFVVGNSKYPTEFYIVNPDKEKTEIIYKVPNTEIGVLYKTRKFHKGLNRIKYIAVYRNLRSDTKKDTVAREIKFYGE